MIDALLLFTCFFILLGCIYLSIKTRFVQLRYIPLLFSTLIKSIANRKLHDQEHTIPPHKALFTAMSTTLGISTIVAPVIAIRLGGPGAMLGFLITSFLGSAATFTEVSLSLRYRKLEKQGISGGPMQYLKNIFNPFMAKWYAGCCLILMMVWSGAQANQLSAIFDSPMLGSLRVTPWISGALIAVLVLSILIGGIKRIGSFSSKLVPLMFILYVGSCAWIVLLNLGALPSIFSTMLHSFFSPFAMASGVLVGGALSALRWGIFKGMQTNEAGVGTQSIPHSMAETKDTSTQAVLAMFSTYMAGFVAFLSGCVAMITNTWQSTELPIGISMVAASFAEYFSIFGIAIVAVSALLFGFGTILGNSYNGSQCFSYLSKRRGLKLYYLLTALFVFWGATGEVTTVWSFIDIIMAFMVVPHMAALVYYAYKQPRFALELN